MLDRQPAELVFGLTVNFLLIPAYRRHFEPLLAWWGTAP